MEVLRELKREMGPIAFSAQYQQNPTPPGGTIIKKKWLVTYDQISSEPGDRIVMSWDIALSETQSGDYSACVILLVRKEIVFVLEVVRGRFPFETLKRKVMEVKGRYRSSTLLIEDSPISRPWPWHRRGLEWGRSRTSNFRALTKMNGLSAAPRLSSPTVADTLWGAPATSARRQMLKTRPRVQLNLHRPLRSTSDRRSPLTKPPGT